MKHVTLSCKFGLYSALIRLEGPKIRRKTRLEQSALLEEALIQLKIARMRRKTRSEQSTLL